jgi:phosphoglycolate phosphatase
VTDRPSAIPPELVPERVRGVIFDLDGTLIDSYAAIAASLNHARSGFGLPPLPADEVRRHVGRGLEALLSELVGPQRVAEGLARFREHYARVYPDATFVLPGVRPTLARLRAAGLALGVASNKPARFGEAILEGLGLRHHFGCVLGPDRVGATKPDPAMLHACLRCLALTPERALYVGDMVLDVATAAEAGVAVVLVPGGSSGVDELRATGQRVLGSFVELARMLEPRAHDAR